MSEQAVKDAAPSAGNSILMRAWQANVARPGDKVISFSPALSDTASADGGTPPLPQRDWTSAIDLVQEAAEAIRISEERAVELENQLRSVIGQAEEEVRQLQKTLAASQQMVSQAEDRARRAEARAQEAESWLVRIHDAVFTAFGSKAKTVPAEASGGEQDTP